MGAAAETRRPYDAAARGETEWLRRRSRPSWRSCSTRRRSRRLTTSPSTRSSRTRRSTRRRPPTPRRSGPSRPRRSHWAEKWDTVLDWSNPPFAKWFVGGKLNVSYNCVDRHVEAGNGDRVAFHWRGEEGEERDITYADLHRDVQKFANALKDRGIEHGRRRRDLPADDPRGRRGDARLRAHRRAAQRRLRRLLADVGQGADGVLRGQGADHRRRRAPQGQDRADQAAGRRGDGRPRAPRDDRRRPAHRRRLRRCRKGATSGATTVHRGRRRRVPGRAAGRRAPALHPLHERLDGEAEGHPAHHRRLPDAGRLDAPRTCSTSSPTRTSTGARPTSAGSPGTPTSSTGRWPTAARR